MSGERNRSGKCERRSPPPPSLLAAKYTTGWRLWQQKQERQLANWHRQGDRFPGSAAYDMIGWKVTSLKKTPEGRKNLMNQVAAIDPSLFRRTVVEAATLPDRDLAILLDIVAFLKQQESTETAADIRRAARQRATALRSLPREQLVAQFREVGERIRRQVIASGAGIDGDWEGD